MSEKESTTSNMILQKYAYDYSAAGGLAMKNLLKKS
jgi:hypothetical protein